MSTSIPAGGEDIWWLIDIGTRPAVRLSTRSLIASADQIGCPSCLQVNCSLGDPDKDSTTIAFSEAAQA